MSNINNNNRQINHSITNMSNEDQKMEEKNVKTFPTAKKIDDKSLLKMRGKNLKTMAGRHLQEVLFERYVLILVTACSGLGVILWLVSLISDYWIVVIAKESAGIHIESPEIIYKWSHSGLWRKCFTYTTVDRPENFLTRCDHHPIAGGISEYDSFANTIKAEVAICIIVVFLILIAAGFAVYSILHPRYTFKRVCAAMHCLTATVLFVLMETIKSEEHLKQHDLNKQVLKDSKIMYGYSYLLSWCVLIIFFMSAVSFLAFSKKRKMLPIDYEQSLR